MKIIDCHCHIFPDKIAGKAVEAIGHFYGLPMEENGTASNLIEKGTEAGISRFVVHSVATTPHQVMSIDDFISRECVKHPGFIGFASLHPDLDTLEEECSRIKELGLKGVKFHPDFQEFYIDEDRALRMYELIPEDLPILFHMGDAKRTFSEPARLARVAALFPGRKFIAAHFGGYHAWDESRKWLIGKTEVYMDTSSSLFMLDREEAVRMIHDHGVSRFLFGTDFPMWNPKEELARFLKLDLSTEEREAILHKNAEQLFGLL